MDTPLYKLYLFRRNLKFYDLTPEAWRDLRARITTQQRELGIRDLFNAEMAWSNERYEFFGVEFYPSIEAVQEYTRRLQALGYFHYIESETYLGLPMDNTYPDFNPEPPVEGEKPVYRLYMARESEYARQLDPDERERAYGLTTENFRKLGGRTLLSAYMRWNNEGYEYFGVERYPNVEALIGYAQFLSSTDWYRLWVSRSHLGTAFGGLVSGVEGEL